MLRRYEAVIQSRTRLKKHVPTYTVENVTKLVQKGIHTNAYSHTSKALLPRLKWAAAAALFGLL